MFTLGCKPSYSNTIGVIDKRIDASRTLFPTSNSILSNRPKSLSISRPIPFRFSKLISCVNPVFVSCPTGRSESATPLLRSIKRWCVRSEIEQHLIPFQVMSIYRLSSLFWDPNPEQRTKNKYKPFT